MFEVTVKGETIEEIGAKMFEMLTNLRPVADVKATETKVTKPAKAATVKEIEPEKSTAPAETAATTTAAAASGASAQSDTNGAADDGPVDPAELKGRLGKLIDKAGPDVVKQIFAEFGAAKFPEVPAEQHRALSVRVDELLAA